MFLISPSETSITESLESFLIRLCQANGFESYRTMALVIRDWMYDNDFEAAGAWPLVLAQANIFHASHSSGFRVRAFKLLDSLFSDSTSSVLERCLLNSATLFSPKISSVSYQNVFIPQLFIRRKGIPVCPECLKENACIPVLWHVEPYQVCHHHQCELISHCPSCNRQLNYVESEQITKCECGYDLCSIEKLHSQSNALKLSQYIAGEKVNGLPDNGLDISERLGIILWFYKRYPNVNSYDANAIVEYFSQWPNVYIDELNAISEHAIDRQIKPFNHTDFNLIFGDILSSCRKLPYRNPEQNIIQQASIDYLIKLVEQNSKSKTSNFADLRLNIIEVSGVLSTSVEQVYRLVEEGYLQLAIRLKIRERLPPFKGAFYLRQVIELRQSQTPLPQSKQITYLPSW
ncbi:TniQ family protein [Photobacterium leiognathi]|uniref:TniQ family protein n=1 Tax=Photobacterium leiognathi TaxID=553611 RepID=UPI0029816311|nr:TniQ family protein [Photobacterium leiognathi]